MDQAELHPIERYLVDNKLSQEAFARAIGKEQSYVSMLLHRAKKKNRPIPADICPAIERATAGKLTRQQLRPDVFGDDLAPAPAQQDAA